MGEVLGLAGSLETLIGTSPTPKTPNMLICPGRNGVRTARVSVVEGGPVRERVVSRGHDALHRGA